jgi:hypothetical protein
MLLRCPQALQRQSAHNAAPNDLSAMSRKLREKYGGDVTVGRVERAAVKRA